MNHDRLIALTNRIAFCATFALFYWVFIFLIITAFDLKIFREHMTGIFHLSLLGIFAILGGAVILNVMSNLSKISTILSQNRTDSVAVKRRAVPTIIAVAVSLPVVCGLLFAGNFLSAEKKKNMLVSAARSLVAENQTQLSVLSDYRFSPEYVAKAGNILKVIKKIDKFFPEVTLIVPDTIEGKKVFLGFGGNADYDKSKAVQKHNFIYSASHDERLYLEKVFHGQQKDYRFSYRKGNYELYFPTQVNGKNMVLYFSDFQRYGKFGS